MALGYSRSPSSRFPQTFETVCNKVLCIDDLGVVYDKVKPIAARWKQFANSLYIRPVTIDIIEANHSNDCELCLCKVLEYWLWKDYNYEFYGPPCWRRVCVAVKEGGGNTALAEDIAREHPLPASIGGESSAGTSIYGLPVRDVHLLDKIYDLQLDFSDILKETRKAFEPELLSKVIDYLETHVHALLGPNKNNPATIQEITKEFHNIQTINDLFKVLQRKYISWFNYELVVELIDVFLPDNQSLKRTWSGYKEKLKDSFHNSGALLIDVNALEFGITDVPPGTRVMIAKVDRRDYTPADLFFFHRAIPKELNIPNVNLYLSFVCIHSLLLYNIPDYLYSALFPLSKEIPQQLASIGITELTCGDYKYDLGKFSASQELQQSSLDIGLGDARKRIDSIYGKDAVTKWLKEGTVSLTVKRVQMLGPPGSGKTCSQHLLLNEGPPGVTDSTPIACRAVKATRVSVFNGCMERVDANALLSKLACNLKEAASKQEKTPIEKHDTRSKPRPKEDSLKTIPIDSRNKTRTTESADVVDDPHSNKILQEIVKAIPEAKANLKSHLVYIVDSGGQTAFQELLPLFTRAASLNIITMDLSKGIHEKLDLKYRIKGEQFSCDPNFSYTNIEFVKNVLSSGAILQPYDTPESKDTTTPQYPGYFVLGTHSDNDKATPQKIEELNKTLSLLTSGSEEKGYCIVSAKLDEIIYPVNTMLEAGPERQEESKKLCNTLFDFYDDTSDDTFNMPVRWFAFELTLLEKAGNHNILEMDDVLSIGRSLEMSEDDTKQALEYLHNVTIILYYPQVLPNLVFVDPHPILDILSRLLALTCNIEVRFLHLLTRARPSNSELINLRKRGIFAKSLLDKLKVDQEFPKSDFIKLMLHLHIIVETQDGYFIPSALPSSTGPPPGSDAINPLLIVWQNPVTEEILPVPRGIFLLAVVKLMKFEQPKFHFPPISQKYFRYRDAMSFRIYAHNELIGTIHFIIKHRHIEIHFTGHKADALKYCTLICEAVTEAINSSSVDIKIKPSHKPAFACCVTEDCEEKCYCIVTNEDEEKVECTLCPKQAIISGQEKYWSWFHVTCTPCESSTEVASSESCSPRILDITCLRHVRSSLQESNFYDSKWIDLGDHLGLLPKTLKAIEDDYTNVGRRLREVLVKWLEGADGVSASWASLVKALETIEDNTVAEHIRCKWIK